MKGFRWVPGPVIANHRVESMSVNTAKVREMVVRGTAAAPERAATGSHRGWLALAGLGAVLTLVALVDMLLVWYPLGFGNTAWEFGVVDQSFSGLPLLTMGLAGLMVAGVGGRSRAGVVAVGVVTMILGLALLSAYALYLLSVPVVLGMTPPEVSIGVKKAIVKTSVMALAFSGTYLVASVLAFRFSQTLKRR